ncbi:nitric oxide reductase activation protein NorD [Sulfurimonas xiamenensis]|uniref:VWA domain-containing protein n=1 Tax=Sulfurimonas xiamenensis TaxID=2590021 RepID=A0AAJ4DMW9_9BACT|nr:VWA domain-containing protein [Sulfurimonas xiamenensis]QFR43461.1 VWA domain-containing protein [Sulfurimonas xiamenensis]
MLHYYLEFEESIGKVWDKYLNKKVYKFHENERVYFADISKSLKIFHHLMGGEKGKDLQITDKRYLNTSRTFLQKIAFLGKEFHLAWQDEDSIYLPASSAYFPTKELNEMLYYWLIAMATRVNNITDENIIDKNHATELYLINKYDGFKQFYNIASEYLIDKYEQLSFIKSLDNQTDKDLVNDYPNPMWIYPSPLTINKTKKTDDEEQDPTREESQDKTDTLNMKKQANQTDDKHETDGFLAFLPESLMSIFEQVNVDRCEDDTFDEDALYHAEDLDEITIGQKQANLSSRIKMDLELKPDTTVKYPLGKGHFIDEWDYLKGEYLINFVRILPQVPMNVIPIELPERLKKTVRKIQQELDLLELDRVKNDNLPYGDEINIDTWIEYCGHQNKSMHHQKFYTTFEKKTRDMATLILADVSLSTEGGITQEVRIIDVIKDSLTVFSEALEKLQDKFAIYTFSSLQNKKVYFSIIKNFKDKYNDLIRGRIDTIKPEYYTRMGAAIRESAKILDKQQSVNKLLLIISDGKPNDEDRYDGRYGIEDTKKALEEVKKKGITPFCITVDLDAKEYLGYLFGRNGYAVVRDGQKLPKVLTEVYINLTK